MGISFCFQFFSLLIYNFNKSKNLKSETIDFFPRNIGIFDDNNDPNELIERITKIW